ncbi:RAMP superfamily CRISPR-associated protein [uncultured Fibrobacter sp.]|uniref:RAMP superfamily CRISPR-associated protein n=1 Tax=uncultured Fibrobacter sp. TaxID=261512 RepID=UPI0025926D16|nr:RAMP superfamily CRISPR-associated protein [uncultured Fibrobacter sp.]
MNLKYTITFYSGWHCGSGLSAGADVDLLVIKNKDGLPFVPGKTMKGLFREAVELYAELKQNVTAESVNNVFGMFNDKDCYTKGVAFFTNAELCEKESAAIVANSVQSLMYRRLTATAIGENGVAVDHSLRRIEVAIPCELLGSIIDLPDDFANVIIQSAGLIKRLGSWRNRGLGRCAITFQEDK